MSVNLHIAIGLVFFLLGFFMRHGPSGSLALYLYSMLPYLSRKEFDEIIARRFIGETSVKLGSVVLMIAMVGILKPESFNLAIVVGWISFFILAIGSVTFMEETNLVKKYKRAKIEKF